VTGTICRDYHHADNGDKLRFIGIENDGLKVFALGIKADKTSYCGPRLAGYRKGEYPESAYLLENEQEAKEWQEKKDSQYKTLDEVTVDDFPTKSI